jgi:hypothetical protein
MILDSSGYDLIVGLPAIVSVFSDLFISMISNAADSLFNVSSDLVHPWQHEVLEVAQEDLETPLPVNFTSALHFMELGYQESCEEYYNQIEEHVSKEFRDSTDIEALLRSKGVKVFVPENWNGISNLEPLELHWRPDLPLSIKPKARPVNPKLFSHAQLEFERLSKYFYVPSTSPIASCLVIAPKATKPFIRFCGDYVTLLWIDSTYCIYAFQFFIVGGPIS